jgi:hypothetical protein
MVPNGPICVGLRKEPKEVGQAPVPGIPSGAVFWQLASEGAIWSMVKRSIIEMGSGMPTVRRTWSCGPVRNLRAFE